ncbi:MAG: hypothetical protein ABJJ07_17930, partial [Maribacter dokdonensis]
MKLLKYIKIITVFFIMISLNYACDDYLEEEIYSDITSENFITQDNADQLVVGVYSSLRDVYKEYTFQYLGTDVFTSKSEIFSFSPTND